ANGLCSSRERLSKGQGIADQGRSVLPTAATGTASGKASNPSQLRTPISSVGVPATLGGLFRCTFLRPLRGALCRGRVSLGEAGRWRTGSLAIVSRGFAGAIRRRLYRDGISFFRRGRGSA